MWWILFLCTLTFNFMFVWKHWNQNLINVKPKIYCLKWLFSSFFFKESKILWSKRVWKALKDEIISAASTSTINQSRKKSNSEVKIKSLPKDGLNFWLFALIGRWRVKLNFSPATAQFNGGQVRERESWGEYWDLNHVTSTLEISRQISAIWLVQPQPSKYPLFLASLSSLPNAIFLIDFDQNLLEFLVKLKLL